MSLESVVAMVAALLTGIILTASQSAMDDSRQRAAEISENLRFVRERSSEVLQPRPFSGIDLTNQTLNGLLLNRADFSEARLEGANLSKMRLSGANMSGASLGGVKFTESRLPGSNLSNANMTGTSFLLADLSGTNFDGAISKQWGSGGSRAGLVMSSVTGGSMRETELQGWVIFGSDLSGVDMQGADVFGASFNYVDLSGANLSESNIGSTFNFGHICYDGTTRWPDGYVPPESDPVACGLPGSLKTLTNPPQEFDKYKNRSLPAE